MRRNLVGPRAATLVAFALVLGMSGLPAAQAAHAAPAKYYFELHEVKSDVPVNPEVKRFAGEALKADLAARPEWQSDLGVGTDREAIVAELKKRKLSGFDLIVKIVQVKKEVKEPNPGSRLKRLSVFVKLAVLGTVIPGEKMSFSGDGEAGAETEVVDRQMDAETTSMTNDAITSAVKQAIDQALLKLSLPKSAPMNESRGKHKAKAN